MNSIHRIGVTIAGLATVATVGGAFVAQGYLAAQQAAAAATEQASAAPDPTADPTADSTATLGPEIVYVNPAPKAPVLHVTRTAPPTRPPVTQVASPSPTSQPTEPSEPGDGGDSDD